MMIFLSLICNLCSSIRTALHNGQLRHLGNDRIRENTRFNKERLCNMKMKLFNVTQRMNCNSLKIKAIYLIFCLYVAL